LKDPFEIYRKLDRMFDIGMLLVGTAFCCLLFEHQQWDTDVIIVFIKVVFYCGLYYAWKTGAFIRYG
jgi:hypothetical protein